MGLVRMLLHGWFRTENGNWKGEPSYCIWTKYVSGIAFSVYNNFNKIYKFCLKPVAYGFGYDAASPRDAGGCVRLVDVC